MGAKSLFKKIKDAYNKEDVFWENEIKANWFVAKVLLNIMIMIVGVLALEYYGVIEIEETSLMKSGMIVLPILLLSVFLCWIFKGEKHWIKYLMCFACLFFVISTNAILTTHATLVLTVPVILSCRYYNKRLTITMAVLTMIGFLSSEILGVFYGLANLNNIPLSNVDLHVGKEGLRYAIEQVGFNTNEYLRVQFIDSISTKFLYLLIISFACVEMSGAAMKMVLNQEAVTKKNTRIEMELSTAGTIQSNMIPSVFPMFPEREEFDVYASMTPAKQVGGDFYDMFLVDKDHLALVMADVSDKGIPAALLMMVTKILISDLTMQGKTPAEVLFEVNNRLCAHNDADMFVTVWLGVYNIRNGKLIASNAGHEYPMLKRNGGEYELIKDKHGLVIAAMEDSEYENYEFELHKGDKLFVYTDGVAEACNASNELFGTERMLKVLNSDVSRKPEEVINAMHKGINDFVGDTDQFDDITMLSFSVCEEDNGK